MLSKQDKDGNVTILIPPDPTTTGHCSDGRHTVFFTQGGRSYRTRSLHKGEAGRFAFGPLITLLLSGLLVWALLSGDPEDLKGVAFISGAACAVTFFGSLGSEKLAWKEALVLFAATALVAQKQSLQSEDTAITVGALFLALVGYVVLWVQRAVWEPFVLTILFFGPLLANRLGFLPNPIAGYGFCVLAFASLFFAGAILADSDTYQRGWNNMRE